MEWPSDLAFLKVIELLHGFFNSFRVLFANRDAITDFIRNELENEVEEEGTQSGQSRDEPLLASETISVAVHDTARQLDHDALTGDDDDPDESEEPVAEDAIQDVQLVLDLTRADHVADLEENENVEHSRQVSRVRCVLQWVVSWCSVECRGSAIQHILAVPSRILRIGMIHQSITINSDNIPVGFVAVREYFCNRNT